MTIIAVAIIGLLLGSVLNVMAIRWDSRLKAVYPPSYCPHGTHRLRAYVIVPSLYYLFSRGKCRTCGGRIVWRYAAGETATACLFGLAASIVTMQAELIAALFLISILIIIVQTDLTDMIIPNKVVAVGALGAMLIRLFIHPLPMLNYLIAAFAGSGALLVIGLLGNWILKKETMGGGDIKLYVFIGFILGIKLTLLSLFLASLFGLIGGIAMIAAGKYALGKVIPFGPYIAAGAIAAYLWGDGLIEWYLKLLAF